MSILCGSIQTGPTTYPAPADPDIPCCYGSALDGHDHCTCWQPVFNREQDERRGGHVTARTVPCHDCAFREGSPELTDGTLLPGPAAPFWCHQGMRKVVRWEHPDGRVAPASPGVYMPAVGGDVAVPLKADGDPANLCAGWLAQHAELVPTDGLADPDDA